MMTEKESPDNNTQLYLGHGILKMVNKQKFDIFKQFSDIHLLRPNL